MKKFPFTHYAFSLLIALTAMGNIAATPGQDNARLIEELARSIPSAASLEAVKQLVVNTTGRLTVRPHKSSPITTLPSNENEDIQRVATALSALNITLGSTFSAPGRIDYEAIVASGTPSTLTQLATTLSLNFLSIYSVARTDLLAQSNSGVKALLVQLQALNAHATRIQEYGQAQRQARLNEIARKEQADRAAKLAQEQEDRSSFFAKPKTETVKKAFTAALDEFAEQIKVLAKPGIVTTPENSLDSVFTPENITEAYETTGQALVAALKEEYEQTQNSECKATIVKQITQDTDTLLNCIPTQHPSKDTIHTFILTQHVNLLFLFEAAETLTPDARESMTLETLQARGHAILKAYQERQQHPSRWARTRKWICSIGATLLVGTLAAMIYATQAASH